MNILIFKKRLKHYPVFSLQDILKNIPNFQYRQLDRWKKKGYLRQIKQCFYMFTDQEVNEHFLFSTANKIYSPSYISLEKALKVYNLIPEEIFQITSISTKKTTKFETDIGNFKYKHIKPSLFWGYKLLNYIPNISHNSQYSKSQDILYKALYGLTAKQIINKKKPKIIIAEPEKAILDYLYLHTEIKTANDFSEIRINPESFRKQVHLKKFQNYLKSFANKTLAKRVQIFLKTIQK